MNTPTDTNAVAERIAIALEQEGLIQAQVFNGFRYRAKAIIARTLNEIASKPEPDAPTFEEWAKRENIWPGREYLAWAMAKKAWHAALATTEQSSGERTRTCVHCSVTPEPCRCVCHGPAVEKEVVAECWMEIRSPLHADALTAAGFSLDHDDCAHGFGCTDEGCTSRRFYFAAPATPEEMVRAVAIIEDAGGQMPWRAAERPEVVEEPDEWAGWSEPCHICGPYAPKHEGGPLFHIRGKR